MEIAPLLALFPLTVLAIVAIVAIVRALTLLGRPQRRVREGRWAEARDAAARLERSWLRVFASTRRDAAYTRALTFHLEGSFDASLAEIAEVRGVAAYRYGCLLLEAANLLLAGRDPARVVDLVEEACETMDLPEDLLMLAHAKLQLGEEEAAAELFARAGSSRPPKAPWPMINDAVFHYLRALYLVRTGRAGEANDDIVASVHSGVESVYVARARALLAPPAPAEEEDATEQRSSLAPQVIVKGGET